MLKLRAKSKAEKRDDGWWVKAEACVSEEALAGHEEATNLLFSTCTTPKTGRLIVFGKIVRACTPNNEVWVTNHLFKVGGQAVKTVALRLPADWQGNVGQFLADAFAKQFDANGCPVLEFEPTPPAPGCISNPAAACQAATSINPAPQQVCNAFGRLMVPVVVVLKLCCHTCRCA